MKQLLQQRATIFTQNIPYIEENVRKLPFHDWRYNAFRQGQTLNPFNVSEKIEPFNGSVWYAVSKGAKYTIVFWNEKIDIICGNNAVDSNEFLKEIRSFIKQLSAAYDIKQIIRFAYAPVYGTTDFSIKEVIGRDSFKGVEAEEIVQNFVFRVFEDINGKRVRINNLINISSGTFQSQGSDKPALIYQLDINSVVGQDTFGIPVVDAFFEKAGGMAEELLNYLHF